MSRASAVALKPLVLDPMVQGLRQRGWRGSVAQGFRAPSSVAAPPMTLRLVLQVQADRYTGLRVGAHAKLESDDATDEVLGFGEDALPAVVVRWPKPASRRKYFDLAVETLGALIDPSGRFFEWVVRSEDVAPAVVQAFLAAVDGPLVDWIGGLTPVERLLETAERDPLRLHPGEASARTLAVFALRSGRPEASRTVLDVVRDGGMDPDGEARLRRFERELAARFPAFAEAAPDAAAPRRRWVSR